MTRRDDERTVRQSILSQRRKRKPLRSHIDVLTNTYNAVQRYARGNSLLSRIMADKTRLAGLLTTVGRLFGTSNIGRREVDAAVRIILASEASERQPSPRRARRPLRVELPPVTATVIGSGGIRRPEPQTSFPRGRQDIQDLPIIDAEIVEAAGGEAVDPQEARLIKQAAAEVITTPQSSNVHSFYFIKERRHDTLTGGILYVTFLAWRPGMKTGERRGGGPGPTYAYFGVPLAKWKRFKFKAQFGSAGKAVWDFLRVRGKGNAARHQHQYQLTRVAALGERDLDAYVPRKITRKGYRTRNLPDLSGRSTLQPRDFKVPLRPREPRKVRGKTVFR